MRTLVAIGVATLLACGPAAVGDTAAQSSTSKSKTSAPAASDLDRLLAPIALYPDTLIAQMLLCSSDPASVTRLKTWLDKNQDLKGTELQDAAAVEGFEPSFVALTLFPQVVAFMAKDIQWTTRLGKTFAANKESVFDSIQRLRAQAQKSGALKDTQQQDVETKTTESGQQVIVIEPANPQVIYVPQYDPQVVYVEDNSADAAVAGVIGFTAGVVLGAAIDNDYYHGPYGWHGGGYMYNDAWDDYADARNEARDDWMDHREELVEERGDLAREGREARTDRAEGRQEVRTSGQSERTDRQQTRQETRPQTRTGSTTEARGYSGGASQATTRERSGTRSDAFSGYSSGKSERAASARGQSSRSSSRGGGGGGGGRRR